MLKRQNPCLPVSIVLLVQLVLLGGCATPPAPEKAEDSRLDTLVSSMDQSLANQAAANERLQQAQRQLELQQQQLQSLNQNLGKALQAPVASECPKPVACPPPAETSSKLVVGGLEDVWFADLDLALTTRIDTGAETSSLDARNIELFERDGKNWVRFEVMNPKTGAPESLERRLRRTVGVNQSGDAEAKRRPVVKLGIVIGHSNQSAEFALSDRTHQSYQATIGRNVLQDVMVVDVSKKNIAPYKLPKKSPDDAGAAR
jgi:hypothetical protein